MPDTPPQKHPLYLFNSLGRELQRFEPITPGVAHLYTCGLTVYNYAHIGNLRAYVFTDTLRRTLQWKGYDVLHVMNVTDVGHLTSDADVGDDKMERAATAGGKTVWEIARFYTEAFERDLAQLNVMPPAVLCRATDHVLEMIDFAAACEAGGYAYELDDGLYFDTSRVPDYGRLALLDLAGQQAGARVEAVRGKRNAADFVLWRRSPKDKQRLMEWPSPWGTGAPGWHLECSAMSLKYLGHRFDIHTGGIDHRQVHHCNEIAQNQAFLGGAAADTGANYWLHNDFLVWGDNRKMSKSDADEAEEGKKKKMSKSDGTFVRLQNLIDGGYHPLAYRYFMLMASYQSQLTFTFDALDGAQKGLAKLARRVAEVVAAVGPGDRAGLNNVRSSRGASFAVLRRHLEADLPPAAADLVDAMDRGVARNLNTAHVLAVLSDALDDGSLDAAVKHKLVTTADLLLGLNLLALSPEELTPPRKADGLTDEQVQAMLAERDQARRERNFKRADEIRATLVAAGVEVQDGKAKRP